MDLMASTVADLVALVRTRQESVVTPDPLPVEPVVEPVVDPVTPVKPVIDTPPTSPAITPPVVRDINTIGLTRPPSSRRDTAEPAEKSTSSVPARPNARLTLTDEGQVTREANAQAGSRDLRE